ncbi:MAG: ATP-binding protein, partial [Pseudomonadales bacterium]|nr:ATP-binding protein [Pseudomonadales bacterium]
GSVINLPVVAKHDSLHSYLYTWEDVTSTAGLPNAKQAFENGEFRLSHGELNKGFTDSAYWFYVALHNHQDYRRELILENDYPMLDTVEAYCAAGKELQYYLLGDHTSATSRPISARNFLVPISIGPQQQAHCFFRVKSSSNIALPLTVSDTHPYIESIHNSQWQLGAFYGIAVGLLIYCVVLLVTLRELMYLYFALHCIGGMLFNAGLDGSLSRYLMPIGLQDVGVLMAVCLAQLGALFFALEFLKVKRYSPYVYRFSWLIAVVLLGYMLLSPLMDTRVMSELIVSSGFAFLVYMLFLGVLSLKNRHYTSLVFLLGWGPMIAAAMLVALSVLGVIQDSAVSIYSMKWAWCIELIVFAFGLGWSIRILKNTQQGSEKQMLSAKRESIDKTQFLAKVSHEVRGPMSGILGLSELLGTTPLNMEQQRYVKAIRNGSQALLEVTNDFLDFSKIEAGKLSLTIRPFDLKDLVKDCAAIYEMAARKKGLKLVCIFEIGTPVVVEGDGGRVRQVLLNLVSNALKYTEIGYIKIRIGLTDQILDQQIVLKITVEDTGVGINHDDVQRLFQNYSQLDQPVGVDSPSTGLGLAICRQLVELMGGTIQLESQPGKGSSFWFTLPVSIKDDYEYLDHEEIFNLITPWQNDVDVPIAYSQSEPEPAPTPLQPEQDLMLDHQLSVDLRVLVVEDNDINLKVIHGFLEKLGLKPMTLHNGLEAVRHITEEANRYDLILMDCEMPLMDGYTAAKKIAEWELSQGLEATPIIALSAHATDMHKQKAMDAGMALHIAKPLTFDKFTDAIDVVLGE